MQYPSIFSRAVPILVAALAVSACDDQPGVAGPESDVVLSRLLNTATVQVDRFGLPAVTTLFVAASNDKDAFNLAEPANDETAFLPTLVQTIMARYGLDLTGATGLADFLLPDVQPLGDLSGFPNGRRLQDDVVDIALGLIFGAFGPAVPGLQSDGVDANDAQFLPNFPYLAGPN